MSDDETYPVPADDDLLMAELRRIARSADPPPELVLATGRSALSTLRLDEELAELVADSEVTPGQLVRGDETIRLLSFEYGSVQIELQIETPPESTGPSRSAGRTLRGLVTGASGAVGVETPEGERGAVLDAQGWFGMPELPPGPLRVRVTIADGTPVRTGWISG
ncbi:hypothetical protein [Plantactinospora sp. CA-290183]|uniref:hypothetical protein n=1 Tax=Plantactinospora sp. CA-290183 TaxID=3240006 RepID=UPI003D8E4319